MNGLSSNNNGDADIKNFTLLAKYIHYRKLLQSNDDKLISEINNIGVLKIDENKDLNNNSHDPNKNLNEDNNLNKNNIEDAINEIKELNVDQLKKDESFSSFIIGNFLDSNIGKNLVAETFNKIVDIQSQFALIKYALQNGQNPMDLFNINLDWMVGKLKTNKITLNGKEIELQEKNENVGLFYPKFYLKCELVFNLFCLYSGDNLFDLFSVEEIGRQFGNYGDDIILYCYEEKQKDQGNKKAWENINKHRESKFKSMDQRNRRIGGFFGFLCSLILIAIIANIVATLSPWILVIIPLGILAGWLIGKVQTFKKRDEIANLYDQQLLATNSSLMGQTFNKFKNDYQQYGPKPPNEIPSDLQKTNPNFGNGLSPNVEKKINEQTDISNNSQ